MDTGHSITPGGRQPTCLPNQKPCLPLLLLGRVGHDEHTLWGLGVWLRFWTSLHLKHLTLPCLIPSCTTEGLYEVAFLVLVMPLLCSLQGATPGLLSPLQVPPVGQGGGPRISHSDRGLFKQHFCEPSLYHQGYSGSVLSFLGHFGRIKNIEMEQ